MYNSVSLVRFLLLILIFGHLAREQAYVQAQGGGGGALQGFRQSNQGEWKLVWKSKRESNGKSKSEKKNKPKMELKDDDDDAKEIRKTKLKIWTKKEKRHEKSAKNLFVSPQNGSYWKGMKAMIPLKFQLENAKKTLEEGIPITLKKRCVDFEESTVEFKTIESSILPRDVLKLQQENRLLVTLSSPGFYQIDCLSSSVFVSLFYPLAELKNNEGTNDTIEKCSRKEEKEEALFHESVMIGSKLNHSRILENIKSMEIAATNLQELQFVPETTVQAKDIPSLVSKGVLSRATAKQLIKMSREKKIVHGRTLTIGAVGCFLSHLKLWEHVARTNRSMLILEEDALLSSRFDETFYEMNHPEDYSILYLGSHPRLFDSTFFTSLRREGTKTWNRVYGGNFGTFGYVISPKGASFLLSRGLFPIKQQVDAVIEETTRAFLNEFHVYAAVAPIVDELKTLRKSKIQSY